MGRKGRDFRADVPHDTYYHYDKVRADLALKAGIPLSKGQALEVLLKVYDLLPYDMATNLVKRATGNIPSRLV